MKMLPSVRTYLLGLVVVVLTPLLAFSAFLVTRSAQHEQEIMAGTVRERTQAAAMAIERDLTSLRGQLFIIVNADRIEPENFAALYARASAAAGQRGLAFILSDPDGKEFVNTSERFGAPLPDNPDSDSVRRVAGTGIPYVSDVMLSPTRHQPLVMLNVPVLRRGSVAYVAGLDVLPAMAQVLAQQQLPADWIATILDRQGHTIARTRESSRFVGQLGTPAFLARLVGAEAGAFPFVSREGVPIYDAFRQVNSVGWYVAMGIPLDVLNAPVRHSTRVLILVGAGTLALALLLATLLGRRIASPIAGLARYAEILGRGETIDLPVPRLREADRVARSLHQASEQLRQTAEEREQAVEEVRQSEQRYRTLVDDLGRANQERALLLRRTVTVQEADRKRIARELHDSLGQYLTALRLGLNAIEPHCRSAAEAVHQLSSLKGLTTEVGRELNRIAWELRPTALDDLGLQTAITQFLEEWGERSSLAFDLQINLGDRRLPQTIETTLYRVVQEAITNVVKHAAAERVGVILEANMQGVQLIIEDDGQGFPPDVDGAATPGTRLGLLGMRERLALLNGSLEVETNPGSGTTLFIRVPC